jgi:hypothetical protein
MPTLAEMLAGEKFGPHSALVEEVFELVAAKRLLQPGEARGHSWEIIRDLEAAWAGALQRLYGPDDKTWFDFCAMHEGRVRGLKYLSDAGRDLAAKLKPPVAKLSTAISAQLDSKHEELWDPIAADLGACVFARAHEGATNAFFEALFAVYQAGGWPCGMTAVWPEGHLIVYLPGEVVAR